MAAKIKSFQDLEIWKRSMKLVEEIYNLTRAFPKDEIYGLTSQLRRSAVSIPSNMAEGFARFHNKEYRQFLYVSLGSCAELTTQLVIASRLQYAPEKIISVMIDETEQISKMTMALIKCLVETID
ncbi:MAG: four helix bundle protein [Sedimentisphaerales bacterium]|jgi:four helix bundle protein